MVIGLDGVPHWLLSRLAADGVMPAIARLLGQGTLRSLTAPVPELSCTSWASFLTGNDPGRHGVYGFVDLLPRSYRTVLTNFAHLRTAPLWAPVQAAGAASVIVNVPGTFPAPALAGALVSGFVATDFDRAIYPELHRQALDAVGYQLDVDVGSVATDPGAFLDRLEVALAARRAGFRHLLAHEPWSLAVCVITETDRLHHFLWGDLMDPAAPLHHRVMDFYRLVDAAVAELVDQIDDDGLILVSDHGFGPSDVQFYVNAWLRRAGYLSGSPEVSLHELNEHTTAFALDPGRIYLNTTKRFPRGRKIQPREREDLLDDLTRRLMLTGVGPNGAFVEDGSGTQLVCEVLRGADVYSGPLAHEAPDLVAMPALGSQIRGGWANPDPLAESAPLTGTHTREDGLFWCRGDTGDGEVQMRDVAPTVLGLMQLHFDHEVDGANVKDRVTVTAAT